MLPGFAFYIFAAELSKAKLYFFWLLADNKCFCEFENGGIDRNGIKCEKNGRYERATRCAKDEICIGPSTPKYSIQGINNLCKKGKFKLDSNMGCVRYSRTFNNMKDKFKNHNTLF